MGEAGVGTGQPATGRGRDSDRGPYAGRVLRNDSSFITLGPSVARVSGWPAPGFVFAPDAGGGAAVDEADLTAADIAWDLDPLLAGATVDELLDQADALATGIEAARGTLAALDAEGLAALMASVADFQSILGRAGSYASLRFAEDTSDETRGALIAKFSERATVISTRLVFFELEWVAVPDDAADALLADERLAFCAYHLRTMRRYRDHVLSEPEEKVLTETSVAGAGAWVRLFNELTSSLELTLPASVTGGDGDEPVTVGLEQGLSLLQHPDRSVRQTAAAAVTAGLEPGLRTRAYVFNTLLLDKSVDDRLRNYPSWISSRNLANEATDESVLALVDAVVARYDLPQRWYALKAQVLGIDKLADYDRMASVASDESRIGWREAKELVLDAYDSFSPELAGTAKLFFDNGWIDAPTRPGKRPGAFCAYTVPEHHPYVFLNWTGRARDVATLAHELGHGLHAYLAREQGVFHQSTPLTLAETASVFGETVTNNALLSALDDPDARFALLAATLEDSIATVFRQVAMNRFEDAVHTERRDVGELSVERFGELWAESQTAMLGDTVEVTEGYRTWWSYIPHFIGTPGYVYAYAYGQLLALSVYARYEQGGAAFVPDYLRLLAAGGSLPPAELGRIVGCDLEDPSFWDAGLDIVAQQLDRAVDAARAAGRLPAE
jgi:oligoendopeptidase F